MLTQILMTRCCHDLAGATGALGNMLQLMEMDASFLSEGTDFLKKATVTLTARLKFFRALGGMNGKMQADTAVDYLNTLSMPFRLVGVPETQADLAFILIGSEILIKGGTLSLRAGELTASGDRLLFPDEKRRLLSEPLTPDDYTPANAALLWARHLLDGKPITVQQTATTITFVY